MRADPNNPVPVCPEYTTLTMWTEQEARAKLARHRRRARDGYDIRHMAAEQQMFSCGDHWHVMPLEEATDE